MMSPRQAVMDEIIDGKIDPKSVEISLVFALVHNLR